MVYSVIQNQKHLHQWVEYPTMLADVCQEVDSLTYGSNMDNLFSDLAEMTIMSEVMVHNLGYADKLFRKALRLASESEKAEIRQISRYGCKYTDPQTLPRERQAMVEGMKTALVSIIKSSEDVSELCFNQCLLETYRVLALTDMKDYSYCFSKESKTLRKAMFSPIFTPGIYGSISATELIGGAEGVFEDESGKPFMPMSVVYGAYAKSGAMPALPSFNIPIPYPPVLDNAAQNNRNDPLLAILLASSGSITSSGSLVPKSNDG